MPIISRTFTGPYLTCEVKERAFIRMWCVDAYESSRVKPDTVLVARDTFPFDARPEGEVLQNCRDELYKALDRGQKQGYTG